LHTDPIENTFGFPTKSHNSEGKAGNAGWKSEQPQEEHRKHGGEVENHNRRFEKKFYTCANR